ncbi:pectinesterase inhibitor-like [Quillaja saponaria]|uniref:Pectinesterase inhibitor-like n=1 Tax=Quillaja saponaria TaxID=32244 RepID=A0AAD7QB46_QUISA|nr:pectinesterase inhibitor-like [Quillaja saponaria]
MDLNKNIHLFVSLACLCILSFSISHVVCSPFAGKPVLDPVLLKICGATENPTLCANSVLPLLHGPVDLVNVLKSEIDATIKEASIILKQITKMNNTATSKEVKSALESCQQMYRDAIDNLKETKTFAEARNAVDVINKLSGVASCYSTCDDSFADFQLQSPLNTQNFNWFIQILLSLGNLLK